MRHIYVSLGSDPIIERRIAIGVGEFAAQQDPKWRVSWGSDFSPGLLSATTSPFDAAIVWGLQPDQISAPSHDSIPMIGTSRRFLGKLPYTVVCDDQAIGRMAAEFFADRGFREILFVGRDFPYAQEQHIGLTEAFPGIVETLWMSTHTWAEEKQSKLFIDSILNIKMPGAIYCDNDWQAAAAIGILHQQGLRIPRDFAVIGAGDDELARMGSPVAISSIDPGWERVGYAAAKLALELLTKNREASVHRTSPPVDFIERRSTDHFATEDPAVLKSAQLIKEQASSGLTVDTVVQASGISRRTLERRFKKIFGRGIDMEIRRQQLSNATRLLIISDKRISDIAEICGFSSLYHFSNAFKKRYKCSPLAYRRSRSGKFNQ